ncbi:hypothetical protein PFISCL1PPCAC_2915, partial [Pristionchus fissidentatus]
RYIYSLILNKYAVKHDNADYKSTEFIAKTAFGRVKPKRRPHDEKVREAYTGATSMCIPPRFHADLSMFMEFNEVVELRLCNVLIDNFFVWSISEIFKGKLKRLYIDNSRFSALNSEDFDQLILDLNPAETVLTNCYEMARGGICDTKFLFKFAARRADQHLQIDHSEK